MSCCSGSAKACGIFRVDNPHTKPLPFWEWMIADVRGRHPDVIFLAEAFTRPKMMYRLAKLGFSQSYTYFTWRNTKEELTDYLTELTHDRSRATSSGRTSSSTRRISIRLSCRPSRPRRLPDPRRAGRDLSGLWGIYSRLRALRGGAAAGTRGISRLARNTRSAPGTSTAPGNIVAEITPLNRLRRAHPALQSHLGLDLLQRLQRPGAGVRQGDGGPRGHDPGRRQPRSAWRAGSRLRSAAVGMEAAR